jgi:hypothetical protein
MADAMGGELLTPLIDVVGYGRLDARVCCGGDFLRRNASYEGLRCTLRR